MGKRRGIQKRGGGYSAGKKPISQLKPPPKGPGAGAKPKGGSGSSSPKQA